jgi:hypothetical protein
MGEFGSQFQQQRQFTAFSPECHERSDPLEPKTSLNRPSSWKTRVTGPTKVHAKIFNSSQVAREDVSPRAAGREATKLRQHCLDGGNCHTDINYTLNYTIIQLLSCSTTPSPVKQVV